MRTILGGTLYSKFYGVYIYIYVCVCCIINIPNNALRVQFIQRGGLKHLFSVFLSGRLQTKEREYWNEVRHVAYYMSFSLLFIFIKKVVKFNY